MKFLFAPLTFWALLVFGILIGLQWFPITGIFLMMLAAPIWVGYMPHVVALALFFDLLIKKAPKILLLVPALPYLVFYGYLFTEVMKIKNLAAWLQRKYQPPAETILSQRNGFIGILTSAAQQSSSPVK